MSEVSRVNMDDVIGQGILYQNAAFVLYGVGGVALVAGLIGAGAGMAL